jgi:hypothetical protein
MFIDTDFADACIKPSGREVDLVGPDNPEVNANCMVQCLNSIAAECWELLCCIDERGHDITDIITLNGQSM